MMMNCFCGMVDRWKAFSFISSRDHCQRSSTSRISNPPRAGYGPAQNLSSGLVEWSCAVVITTTPRRHKHAGCHLLILVTNLLNLWALRLMKEIKYFWIVTWSHNWIVKWLCWWVPLILIHQPAKFGTHSPCENGVFYLSCNHVNDVSRDFVGVISLSWVTKVWRPWTLWMRKYSVFYLSQTWESAFKTIFKHPFKLEKIFFRKLHAEKNSKKQAKIFRQDHSLALHTIDIFCNLILKVLILHWCRYENIAIYLSWYESRTTPYMFVFI